MATITCADCGATLTPHISLTDDVTVRTERRLGLVTCQNCGVVHQIMGIASIIVTDVRVYQVTPPSITPAEERRKIWERIKSYKPSRHLLPFSADDPKTGGYRYEFTPSATQQ